MLFLIISFVTNELLSAKAIFAQKKIILLYLKKLRLLRLLLDQDRFLGKV